MCDDIRTLKHNVRTTLRLTYHGCKNLTRAKHVKYNAPQWLQLPGSGFPCLLLFQTAENRTQRNRCAKGREVTRSQNRCQRNPSIGVLTFDQPDAWW